MPERFGYRRKVLLHARLEDSGWEFGFIRKEGREEHFVSIPNCPIHDPKVNQILEGCKPLLSRDWPLRFVLVSGAMVTFVFKSKREARFMSELERLEVQLKHLGVIALFANWNPSAGYRVLAASKMERVFGPEWIEEEGLWHGPIGFQQQIPALERRARLLAKSFFKNSKIEKIVDFYSGLGASLQLWSDLDLPALGVELSGESLLAAARNAPKATLLRGRVEDRIPQVNLWLEESEFGLYTNPPRDGQGNAVNAWIRERKPKRIAYLSCNVKSLARDLASFGDSYQLKNVYAFDFFPNTDHVEVLAFVQRSSVTG